MDATSSALRRALARARDGKTLDRSEATTLLQARGAQLDDLLAYAARTRDAGLEAAGRAGRHHLQPQGLHPADPAVPRPLRVLHVRDRPAPPGRAVPEPRRGSGDRAPGRRDGLQGGPVHARGPARGPVAAGPRMARRPRLRRHALLRARHGDPGAGGDRAAAAPEPRRADLARLPAAQAGRAVDGHDAGDDGDAAVRASAAARTSARPTRTRRSGCGSWRTRDARTCRSPPASSSASARRSRSARSDLRDPRGRCGSTAAIQEVIVQNFRAKPDTKMRDTPDAELDELAATIAVTRLVLGPKARVQAPPNLVGDRVRADAAAPASTTGAACRR